MLATENITDIEVNISAECYHNHICIKSYYTNILEP